MGLVELRISDLAVIRSARLEPGPEFTVVTGETGAGKSICVTALRLALGGRPEGEVVRPGADAARVVAVFDAVPDQLQARLDELGVPAHEVVSLSRELPRSGRSTARINGALVSQTTLGEVGEVLAEVTVQGASQRLLNRGWQRQLLDSHGGSPTTELRDAVRAALARWRVAQAQLHEARTAAASGVEEEQRAAEIVAELAPLELVAGEDAALMAEAARLRHSAGIAAAAEAVRAAAGGGDDALGAADLLAAAVEQARPLCPVDPALRALVDRATSTVHDLRDLVAEARHCSESVSVDESRLASVNERLDVLARVRRRHPSIEAALATLATAEATISGAAGRSGALTRLTEGLDALAAEVIAAAGALSESRSAAAAGLEVAVTERLRLLELPHARFQIVVRGVPDPSGFDLGDGPVRCGPHGADEVEFRLAANRDGDPRPLDAGPSGGELSRVALAVGSVVTSEGGPVLVLDEVDSGISGETAARVGDVLAAMGRIRQVIAVTHRSEIAARAGSHLLAVKAETPAGTETTVEALAGERRTGEIARLMSGRTTEAAMARAGELLGEGSLSGRR